MKHKQTGELNSGLKKSFNFALAKKKSVKSRKLFQTILLLFFSIGTAYTQTTGTKLVREIQYDKSGGNINIVQKEDVLKLLDKHLYEQSRKRGIRGYRILIFSDSGPLARKKGKIIEAQFIGRFKGVRPYFTFDTPFYRLNIGDFRTRSDAWKFLKMIEKEYPDAYFVPCRINYPEL